MSPLPVASGPYAPRRARVGTDKYPIKSTVIQGKRKYVCPYENCGEVFGSSGGCDSHLNAHLGIKYGPCPKCRFRHRNIDMYESHVCFKNLQERKRRKKDDDGKDDNDDKGSTKLGANVK